jgi:hypothetical protein
MRRYLLAMVLGIFFTLTVELMLCSVRQYELYAPLAEADVERSNAQLNSNDPHLQTNIQRQAKKQEADFKDYFISLLIPFVMTGMFLGPLGLLSWDKFCKYLQRCKRCSTDGL